MIDRRTFLAGVGTVLGTGCVGRSADQRTGIHEHPSTDGIESLPLLGPPVGESEATVVAFEDPSSGQSAGFHLQSLPEIRSELVDPGRVTYVSRVVPVGEPWSVPAAHALAATYERDEEEYWTLLEAYYDGMRAFDADTVFDLTRAILAERTELDADGIVSDAREEQFADIVEANESAGEAAGVGTSTPIFLLFREGEFATTLIGNRDYRAFSRALGYPFGE